MEEITQQRVSKKNSARIFQLQAELNHQSNFILPNFDAAVGYLLDQYEESKETIKRLEERLAPFEDDKPYDR